MSVDAATPSTPAVKPTLRERQARERRDELIDAALTTFARRGYHATSLKEIAEARHNPEVAEALGAHPRRTLAPTERLLMRLAERGHLGPRKCPSPPSYSNCRWSGIPSGARSPPRAPSPAPRNGWRD